MIKKSVYLDNAAATPMDKAVKIAMEPYFSVKFYNPSAQYLSAKAVSKDIETARTEIAHWLGAKSTDIFFTAGGTEANNLALNGIMSLYPEANLVVSAIEHESILKPAEQYNHKVAPVDGRGNIDLAKLEKLIDDKTVLVSVMYANNEVGTIQPLSQITKMIEKIRKSRNNDGNELPIYLHADACQAPTYLDLHVAGLGVDLMTLNSGKIYGPKQFGALYVNRHVNISPQILGGGQERGLRSGTESPANIIGFAKALNLVQDNRTKESERLSELQNFFIRELVKIIPNIKINGSIKKRLPNNVHITIPGQDNELILMKLDELGIQCASGSACNASSDDISPTLIAIGLSEEDAKSSLRFTMGNHTKKNDIEFVVSSIAEILE